MFKILLKYHLCLRDIKRVGRVLRDYFSDRKLLKMLIDDVSPHLNRSRGSNRMSFMGIKNETSKKQINKYESIIRQIVL